MALALATFHAREHHHEKGEWLHSNSDDDKMAGDLSGLLLHEVQLC